MESDYICSICKTAKDIILDLSVDYPNERCCQTCFHKVGSKSTSKYWRCEQCKNPFFGSSRTDSLEGFVILSGRVYCFVCMKNPKLTSAFINYDNLPNLVVTSDKLTSGRYVELD